VADDIDDQGPGTAHDADGRPVRVLVAGGRLLGRVGLGRLLGAEDRIEVVGLTGDELSTRAAVDRQRVDVVVTHVFLGRPGGGARLAARLHEEAPEVGVVVLLGESDPGEVRRVLEHGTGRRALLLLDHPRCATDLLRAVEDVAGGSSFVHHGVVDLLLRHEDAAAADRVQLTPRESQVLAGIASGASNRRIAANLDASERAVEKHINQLYAKLEIPAVDGVHRRVLAARRALGLPALRGLDGTSGGATPDQVRSAPLAVS
jgi:DNA-binding NarL/FixJ family response regulator